MKRAGILALLVIVSFVLLPGAMAHGPGTESTHLEGTLSLSPSGTAGSTVQLPLSPLGEVEARDELRYFWSANAGLGPAVRFEIMREVPYSPAERVYMVTAATQTETWMIPASGQYAVSWENPSGEAISVSYLFEVLAPIGAPVAFDWPLYVGLGAAGVVFAFLFFWSGRRRKQGSEPSDTVTETGPEEK